MLCIIVTYQCCATAGKKGKGSLENADIYQYYIFMLCIVDSYRCYIIKLYIEKPVLRPITMLHNTIHFILCSFILKAGFRLRTTHRLPGGQMTSFACHSVTIYRRQSHNCYPVFFHNTGRLPWNSVLSARRLSGGESSPVLWQTCVIIQKMMVLRSI